MQWRLQSVIEKIQPCHYLPPLNSLDFWFKPSRHHHYCSCHAYKNSVTWTSAFCWQWRCSLAPVRTVAFIFDCLFLAHSESSIPQEESTCGGFPNGKSLFSNKITFAQIQASDGWHLSLGVQLLSSHPRVVGFLLLFYLLRIWNHFSTLECETWSHPFPRKLLKVSIFLLIDLLSSPVFSHCRAVSNNHDKSWMLSYQKTSSTNQGTILIQPLKFPRQTPNATKIFTSYKINGLLSNFLRSFLPQSKIIWDIHVPFTFNI